MGRRVHEWFMKEPFLGLICFGVIIDGYEVQCWTFNIENGEAWGDPYGVERC